jgi:hypothetical protein
MTTLLSYQTEAGRLHPRLDDCWHSSATFNQGKHAAMQCKLRMDEIDADFDEVYTSAWWTTNAAAEEVRDVHRYSGLTALRSMGYREAFT